MGRVGLEHPPLKVSKTPISAKDGAKSDAHGAPDTIQDSDLSQLIKEWTTLPKQIKTKIIGLIEKRSTEVNGDGQD
jgi:hypothetical protein